VKWVACSTRKRSQLHLQGLEALVLLFLPVYQIILPRMVRMGADVDPGDDEPDGTL